MKREKGIRYGDKNEWKLLHIRKELIVKVRKTREKW
jgi:hypothetical protein